MLSLLMGCSSVGEYEFVIERTEFSEWETWSERFDSNMDGVKDSEAVHYLTTGKTVDFLMMYWVAFLCDPEVQDIALDEKAYWMAVNFKIEDNYDYDFAFWDSDRDGDLDSLFCISADCYAINSWLQGHKGVWVFD